MKSKPIAVKIKDNETCICGSNKSFSECCKSKNHQYEALLLNSSRKKVVYDQTEIVNTVTTLLNYIETRINSINTSLSPEEALRKLKKLYQLLGQALAPMGRVTSCKAGCTHCCHLLVYTSQLEKEMIEGYINKNFSEDMKSSLRKKLLEFKPYLSTIESKFGATFTDDSKNLYAEKKIPCAFLQNNLCIIYEARPYICRKYLVFNDPKVCENPLNNTEQYYAGFMTTVKDAIYKLNKLAYGTNYESKHILNWFL